MDESTLWMYESFKGFENIVKAYLKGSQQPIPKQQAADQGGIVSYQILIIANL